MMSNDGKTISDFMMFVRHPSYAQANRTFMGSGSFSSYWRQTFSHFDAHIEFAVRNASKTARALIERGHIVMSFPWARAHSFQSLEWSLLQYRGLLAYILVKANMNHYWRIKNQPLSYSNDYRPDQGIFMQVFVRHFSKKKKIDWNKSTIFRWLHIVLLIDYT